MNSRVCFYSRPFPGIHSYYALIDASVAHGLTKLEAFGFMELSQPIYDAFPEELRKLAERIKEVK